MRTPLLLASDNGTRSIRRGVTPDNSRRPREHRRDIDIADEQQRSQLQRYQSLRASSGVSCTSVRMPALRNACERKLQMFWGSSGVGCLLRTWVRVASMVDGPLTAFPRPPSSHSQLLPARSTSLQGDPCSVSWRSDSRATVDALSSFKALHRQFNGRDCNRCHRHDSPTSVEAGAVVMRSPQAPEKVRLGSAVQNSLGVRSSGRGKRSSSTEFTHHPPVEHPDQDFHCQRKKAALPTSSTLWWGGRIASTQAPELGAQGADRNLSDSEWDCLATVILLAPVGRRRITSSHDVVQTMRCVGSDSVDLERSTRLRRRQTPLRSIKASTRGIDQSFVCRRG